VGSEFSEQRDELLESIERDQEELLDAVHELTDAAQATFDLSERIKEFPLTWLIGGLVVGLWLGYRPPVPMPMPVIVTKEGGRRR
jgi:hypothetical protein